MLYLLAVLAASWLISERVIFPMVSWVIALIYAGAYLAVYRTSVGMREHADMLNARIIEKAVKYLLGSIHAATAIALYTYDWSSLQWIF